MKRIYSLTLLILIAYILSGLVRTFFIQVYFIPTVSMEPTLNTSDRVLVTKNLFFDQSINSGDIVVFYPDENIEKSTFSLFKDSLNINKLIKPETADIVYIKRVIGKENDRVRITLDGSVYINEVRYKRFDESSTNLSIELDLVVPNNKYFVLGDNIENSIDSRSYGFISHSNLLGKAIIKIYPFNEITLLND